VGRHVQHNHCSIKCHKGAAVENRVAGGEVLRSGVRQTRVMAWKGTRVDTTTTLGKRTGGPWLGLWHDGDEVAATQGETVTRLSACTPDGEIRPGATGLVLALTP
jgi:IS5 family transposase